jgi:hypothetical protein
MREGEQERGEEGGGRDNQEDEERGTSDQGADQGGVSTSHPWIGRTYDYCLLLWVVVF